MRAAVSLFVVLGFATVAVKVAESPLVAPFQAKPRDLGAATIANRWTSRSDSAAQATPSTAAPTLAASRAATPQAPAPNAINDARAPLLPRSLQRADTLPRTLELIALPGSKAQSSRTLTREEAIASVIASPDYQETVSPLARLYLATFGRYPDYEGINHYTGQREQARPLASIADEFAGSPEFRSRYGETDNAQFVEIVFTNVLGHPSQADVRAYWVGELDSGRMTRGQVLLDLAESGAFRERSLNQVLVASAYLEILQRTPDPEGFARWVAHLDAGHPWQSVIDGLLSGREAPPTTNG